MKVIVHKSRQQPRRGFVAANEISVLFLLADRRERGRLS